jgi:hypothetical protein
MLKDKLLQFKSKRNKFNFPILKMKLICINIKFHEIRAFTKVMKENILKD